MQNLKIITFHTYFLDISLIIALICLKNLYVYTLDLFGEKVVKNFDIGLSFCFIVCRTFQKLPVFCHKIKTKA